MSKTLEFTGIISIGWMASDSFDRVFLEQSDGYKIELLSRLNEAVYNYGRRVSVRYWIASEPATKDELITDYLRSIDGDLGIDFSSYERRYSEYTSDMIYETDFRIGGHNLLVELRESAGKYLHLEIDFG